MNDYTISETFTLPSEGKIYQGVSPKVTLRSMTTQDEMIRLSPSEDTFLPMCQLIDNCMVEDPGISSYDMCIGDYLFLLHKLRIVTYGPNYKMVTTCPFCGSRHESVIDLESLDTNTYNEENEKLREFTLPVTKKVVRIKYQTPRMIDNMTAKERELRKKSKNTAVDNTIVYTLAALIDTIDGRKPDPIKLEEWCKKLPMNDTNTILNYAVKLNNSIGMTNEVEQTCDVCLLDFKTKFQMTNEFFRPTLDI